MPLQPGEVADSVTKLESAVMNSMEAKAKAHKKPPLRQLKQLKQAAWQSSSV